MRWCATHKMWEHPERFGSYYRDCQDSHIPRATRDAAEVADAVARQSNPAAEIVTERLVLQREWSNQTQIVDGWTARRQVRAFLGRGVGKWVRQVTGKHGSTDEDIDGALTVILERLEGNVRPAVELHGFPMTSPVSPTTCACCGHPTCATGFVGKSICLLCAASGKGGLALVDANHALVTGMIHGTGMHSIHSVPLPHA